MAESTRDDRPLSEAAVIQNPALGAFTLWKFGLAYQTRSAEQPVLPLVFLVLPLVLHKATRDLVAGTQRASGLALFAQKLGEHREDLLAVHDRAMLLRSLTLESIAVGVGSRLLSLNFDHATLRSNAIAAITAHPQLPERIRWATTASEKLGHWFAAVSDQQIVRTLRVDF